MPETAFASKDIANSKEIELLTRVGPYKILQPLGRGGMGQVFLAEQTEPVIRRVAVKVINTDTPTKEILARFEAERQALAMMEHQHIAKVFDAGVTNTGRPYFVMEWVKGVPISEHCDKNKLSPEDRLELFVQTCRAIQHAHAKGIVHRDIKPSNVLVTLDDGKPTVKVIDFGLAKAMHAATRLTDRTLFTQHGQIVGTLAYMSPEQAELSSLDIDTRTDVYSLGVVLYELLTGSTPITADEIRCNAFDRILALIREADPPRPSIRLSDSGDALTGISQQRRTDPRRLTVILKGDLDWIAMKALEKDRNRRYDTAAALADDVQRFLKNEAIEARPPSFKYQLQKSFRKHRVRYLAASTMLCLLLAGLAGTGTMWHLARKNYQQAKANERRAIEQGNRADAEAEQKRLEANRANENEELAKAEAAAAKFQLANARWDAGRAGEARRVLHQIPAEYRDNFEWHYCNRRFRGSEVSLYGHTSPVLSACYSPNGERIVSGSRNELIIWDAITGKSLIRREGASVSVSCSPDGGRIASISGDGVISIWNLNSSDGERFEEQWDKAEQFEIETLSKFFRGNPCVQFSPDGKYLAANNINDGITIWNADTGEEFARFGGQDAGMKDLFNVAYSHYVGFSPEGKYIALANSNGLKLWNAQATSEEGTVESILDVRAATNLSFSPDGTTVASSSARGISLWNLVTGTERTTIQSGETRSVSISPDGSFIAAGGFDGVIGIWDESGHLLPRLLAGHDGPVNGVCFSPHGHRLLSWGQDQTLKIWNSVGGDETAVVMRDVEFKTNEYSRDFQPHLVRGCLGFSPKKQAISFLSDSSTITEFDLNQYDLREFEYPKTTRKPLGQIYKIRDLAYRSDGTCVAATTEHTGPGLSYVVKWWNTHTETVLGRADIQRKSDVMVRLSPQGSRIATASTGEDGLLVWDVQTGRKLRALDRSKTGNVYQMCFSPSGSELVTINYGSMRLWDVSSGKELVTFDVRSIIASLHSSSPTLFTGVCFNASGNLVLTGDNQGTLVVWDAKTGRELETIAGHKTAVTSIASDHGGNRFASADRNGSIKLWELREVDRDTPDSGVGIGGSELLTLQGHQGAVTSLRFRHDGRQLASCGEDETLRIWDATPIAGANLPISALAYRSHIGRPRASWHQQRCDEILEESDEGLEVEEWFAIAFHSAWICKMRPTSAEARDRLRSAHQHLVFLSVLPPGVKEALALPDL
nr:protein kinase [Rhodopirellula sp. JC639]